MHLLDVILIIDVWETAVMWTVNRGALDMTRWNNETFILQMTLQFLIAEDIRIYMILILYWCLFFALEILNLQKSQRNILLQKRANHF